VKHKGHEDVAVQCLDTLFIPRGTKGDNAKGLRFTSREKRRTMRTRQHTCLALDGTDLIEATAVNPASFCGGEVSHDFSLKGVKDLIDFPLAIGIVVSKGCHDVGFDLVKGMVTLELAGNLNGFLYGT
jgi:hypothetical protein